MYVYFFAYSNEKSKFSPNNFHETIYVMEATEESEPNELTENFFYYRWKIQDLDYRIDC